MDGGIERRIRCRCDLPAAKEKEEVKDGWMVRRGEKNCLPACQPATLPTRCLPISHPATLPTSLPVKDPLPLPPQPTLPVKDRIRCPPAYRASRADKEKDKKEGLESKGAVAVKDGGMEGWIESKGAVAPPPLEPTEPIRRRIRKKDS